MHVHVTQQPKIVKCTSISGHARCEHGSVCNIIDKFCVISKYLIYDKLKHYGGMTETVAIDDLHLQVTC